MDTLDLLEEAEDMETLLAAALEEACESRRLIRSAAPVGPIGAICLRAAAVRGGALAGGAAAGGSLFVLQGERGERG